MMQLMNMGGTYLRVITDENVVETEREDVQRSWRERLWSWPWYPWLDEKTVYRKVAGSSYLIPPDVLVTHPRVLEALREVYGSTDLPGVIAFDRSKPRQRIESGAIVLSETERVKRTGHEKAPYYLLFLLISLIVIVVVLL